MRTLPKVRKLVTTVQEFRHASKSKPTRELATTPTLYHVNVLPDEPFLVVPEVSSERREYVPIGWLEPPAIPSNLIRVMENATLADFALLTSAMHMTWLRYVGGRLESRYRYSIGLVYNTFPVPSERANLASLEPLAQNGARCPRYPSQRKPSRPVCPGPDAAKPAEGSSDIG